jgi:protease secretion system outer membrane protein
MLETQARLDAEAAVLEGRGDLLTTARETLATVIGREPGVVDELVPDFRVRPADTVSFEAWKNIALERNRTSSAGSQPGVTRQE